MPDQDETQEHVKDERMADDEQLIQVTLYPEKAVRDSKPAGELDEIVIEKKRLSNSLAKVLNRDMLPFFILSMLSSRPHFGTELMAVIREHGSLWSSSPGTIYPMLTKMEKEGLIRGWWEKGPKRDRHVYELTQLGGDWLQEKRASTIEEMNVAISTLEGLLSSIKANLA